MNLFRKRKDEKPDVPSLHFAGWGYDDREDTYVYRDQGANVQVVAAAGQSFILRKIDAYVFFRDVNEKDERTGWYLTEPYSSRWQDDIKKFPPERFVTAYKQQAYGRCLLFVAEFMQAHQCAFLCFAPDGTGFGIDYTEERLVDFRWRDVSRMTWAELRTADPEALRPLCKSVFDTLIHPRLTNPYIAPNSLKEIPQEFICGSEQELRRLTTFIVHSDPELFAANAEPVTVVYRAQTPYKRAYMMKVMRGEADEYDGETITERLGRLQSLCDLALRLNTFVGLKWETWMDAPNRLGDFRRQVQQMRIVVHPPSAHERAEALLSLSDWLEGKVREEKRLRLLGVD